MDTPIQVNRDKLRQEKATLESAIEGVYFLLNAINSAIDGMAVLNQNQEFVYVNDAHVQIYGYESAGELLGSHWQMLYPEKEQRRFDQEVIPEFLKTGRWHGKATGLHKDGSTFPQELSLTTIEEGGWICIVRDISLRVKMEAELQEKQRASLHQAYLAGIAENAVSVLHNIRNAITPAIVNVHKLLSDHHHEQLLDYLERSCSLLNQHAQTDELEHFLKENPKGQQMLPFLNQLIEQLKVEVSQERETLAGIDSQLQHINSIISLQQKYANFHGLQESFRISEVISDVLGMMQPAFEKRNIQLHTQFEPIPQAFTTDKNKVVQVLMNLFKNSVESIDQQLQQDASLLPEIHVQVSLIDSDTLNLTIQDNGAGASEETLRHVFEFGFSTKDRGSGFGLHDSANFLRSIGGEIRLHSRGSGMGATAQLTFPIAQGDT